MLAGDREAHGSARARSLDQQRPSRQDRMRACAAGHECRYREPHCRWLAGLQPALPSVFGLACCPLVKGKAGYSCRRARLLRATTLNPELGPISTRLRVLHLAIRRENKAAISRHKSSPGGNPGANRNCNLAQPVKTL